ncbi:MAG: hypothetical protein AAGE01_10760 [Pseudomonadota bacterium]
MGGPSTWVGRYAGVDVVTDFPWTGLVVGTPGTECAAAAQPADGAVTEVVAKGFLADAARDFRCAWQGRRAQLSISGIGDISLDLDAGRAHAIDSGQDATAMGLALTGPALALLLAARGSWMLHGSAVRHGDAALLLLGESGVGKSTLARQYADSGRRLADDLVACRLDDDGLRWPGALPQPRLPDEFDRTSPRRVARIVMLEPGGDEPVVRELSPADQSLALIRHTVATRLFPSWLLESHLAWAAAVAARKRCVALSYAQVPAKLRAMVALLETL